MAKWGGVKKCPACLENSLVPADGLLRLELRRRWDWLAGWKVCGNPRCEFVFDPAGEIVGRWVDGVFEEVDSAYGV